MSRKANPTSVGLFVVIGTALLIAGIVYFMVVGGFLLPAPREKATGAPAKTKTYFADVYGIEGDLFELLVTVDSPLVGMTIADAEQMEGLAADPRQAGITYEKGF